MSNRYLKAMCGLLVCGALASGCAVYKVSPALDTQYSAQAQTLTRYSQLSVQPDPVLEKDYVSFSGDLFKGHRGTFEGLGPNDVSILKAVHEPNGGFQCDTPFLLALTLGVIPARCVRTSDITLAVDGKQYQLQYTQKAMAGWISLLYSIFPGWTFDSSANIDDLAFVTLVNQAAAGPVAAK